MPDSTFLSDFLDIFTHDSHSLCVQMVYTLWPSEAIVVLLHWIIRMLSPLASDPITWNSHCRRVTSQTSSSSSLFTLICIYSKIFEVIAIKKIKKNKKKGAEIDLKLHS